LRECLAGQQHYCDECDHNLHCNSSILEIDHNTHAIPRSTQPPLGQTCSRTRALPSAHNPRPDLSNAEAPRFQNPRVAATPLRASRPPG
jgi:hypothetical protein